MVTFTRVPRERMHANHRAHAETRRAPAPKVVQGNIETVLDLGDRVYITFRGRAYGVPPVGWRLGQRLLALRHRGMEAGQQLTSATQPAYERTLAEMAAVLWSHLQPVAARRTGTAVLRARKRLHLIANPLRDATEQDLVVLLDFCLRRRMMSTIGPWPTPPLPRSMTT